MVNKAKLEQAVLRYLAANCQGQSVCVYTDVRLPTGSNQLGHFAWDVSSLRHVRVVEAELRRHEPDGQKRLKFYTSMELILLNVAPDETLTQVDGWNPYDFRAQ